MRNILSITQSFPVVVVTTFDGINPGAHDYMDGLIVRLMIPPHFGMVQANQLSGTVTVIDANSFTLDIDTRTFDPFVVPGYVPGKNGTPANVVPVGSVNEILTPATQNVLPY
jgi:hypothetical protein